MEALEILNTLQREMEIFVHHLRLPASILRYTHLRYDESSLVRDPTKTATAQDTKGVVDAVAVWSRLI